MKKPKNILASYLLSEKILPWLLFIFSLLLYSNSILNDYNMDDELVTRNHHLTSKGISAIPEIFTSPYYKDNKGYAYEYRPMVHVSFALEHSLLGQNAHISHLINVLLYAISVVVLFKTLQLLFWQYHIILPLTATLLFAAHPMHTEAVASIKNRDEILALLFAMCSWIGAIKFVENKRWWLLPIVAILFVASVLSKQSTMSMTLLIPVSLVVCMKPVYRQVLILSLIYSVIFFLLAPLHRLSYKVILSAVIFIVPLLAQVFIFNTALLRQIKAVLVNLLFSGRDNASESAVTEPKTIGLLKWHPITALLLTLLLMAPVFLSLYWDYSPLAFWSVVLISILLFLSDTKAKQYFFMGLLVSILAAAAFYSSGIMHKLIVLMFTAMMFARPAQSDIIFKLIFLAIAFIPSYFLGYGAVIFSAFALIIYYFSQKKAALLIPFVLLTGLSFFKAYKQHTYFIEAFLLIMMAAGAWLYLKSRFSGAAYAWMLAVLLMASGYQLLKVNKKARSFEKINTTFNVYHTSFFKTNRPIDFLEMPLSYDAPFDEKLGTSAYVLAEYLKLMIVPYPMRFYYGYAQIVPVSITSNIQVIVSLLIHLFLFVAALLLIKKHPPLSFGIIFYLASISIFSNLLYPVVGVMGDRFTYVASTGFCITAAYVILKAFRINILPGNERRVRPAFGLFLTIVLSCYAVIIITRNAQWKNQLTLMRHDIRYLEKSAQAHNLLASNLIDQSLRSEHKDKQVEMLREAVNHYRKAIEIYPEFFNAWYDLARTYQLMNNLDSAYVCFLRVHELDSTLSRATLFIAMLAEQRKDYNTAIKYYEKLIRINPYVKEGYANLSFLYFRLGMNEKSIETNKKAIAYNPSWREPYENIARVYYVMKDTAMTNYYWNEAQKR
jgi:tetratricopeptide (TPR) repeat protein